MTSNKYVIFDLDGTLRETKSGKKFINDPEDQKPIAGAIALVDSYIQDGWGIFGCTNQGGVEHGFKTLDDCIAEQINTLNLFIGMGQIYFCPDKGRTAYTVGLEGVIGKKVLLEEDTYFRKPERGMIDLIRVDIYFDQLRMLRPVSAPTLRFIGDMQSDKDAADAAGIEFEWASEAIAEYQ